MTPHRRRASPVGSQFTFTADGRDGAQAVEYDAWAERIKGGNGYFGKSDDLKFGAWSRGAQEKVVGGSGAPSPPLWKKDGSPGTEARGRYVDRETYPTARARDIARYRQEMLDMVKDLPESGYELSLRDIVVQPATPPRTPPREAEVETPAKGKGSPGEEAKAAGKDRIGTEKGVKQLSRSENMGAAGFFLKMFMPVALGGGGGGGGRRRITSGGANSRTKVSPRPSFEVEKGGSEGSDGEWWRHNELSGSGGSNSSNDNSTTSNSNSSSSSSSNRSRKMKGCFHF